MSNEGLPPLADWSLRFPVMGVLSLREAESYPLFGALCQVLPEIRQMDGLQIARLRDGSDGLPLLEMRTPAVYRDLLLTLAGRPMWLHGQLVALMQPEVVAVTEMVTPSLLFPAISFCMEDEVALEDGRTRKRTVRPEQPDFWPRWCRAFQRQLQQRGIDYCECQVEMDRRGQPVARSVRIKTGTVPTVQVQFRDLTPEQSLTLLSRPLGRKPRLGCGVGIPA